MNSKIVGVVNSHGINVNDLVYLVYYYLGCILYLFTSLLANLVVANTRSSLLHLFLSWKSEIDWVFGK